MKTILAVDFDRWAIETYRANFPGVDARHCRVDDILSELHDGMAEIVLSGFPCQPHSLAGKRLGSADERDGGETTITAIRRVMPRHAICENVPGILSSEGGRYFARFIREFEKSGYVVEWRELRASAYGVPQFRRRIWMWGIRADIHAAGMRHQWPSPTHCWPPQADGLFGRHALLAGVTVGQALGIWYEGCDFAPGDVRDVRVAVGDKAAFSNGPNESPSDAPSFTLTANDNHGIMHPTYDHGLADPRSPCPTIKAGANVDASGHQGGGCPPAILSDSQQGKIAEALGTTIKGRVDCSNPSAIPYRWSAAMLAKHPPASPIMAKYAKGGAEGLIRVDPSEAFLKRFWQKIDMDGPVPLDATLGKCWKWTGGTISAGYGAISADGDWKKNVYAHRVSYELHVGQIPDDMWVLHRCDNPACVNPAHLFLGTPKDNTQDMMDKGRLVVGKRHFGEKNSAAKLTNTQRNEIRGLIAAGEKSLGEIAKLYGVTKTCIFLIKKGGAEGLIEIADNAKHQPHQPHQPANTLNSGGDGHGMSAANQHVKLSSEGRTWESHHPPATPAPTVRARSPRDGGRCTENIVREGLMVRRLTTWEVMRLMSAPDSFVWPDKISKTAKYRIAGNGQASGMTAALAAAFRKVDPDAETMIDLFCGGGLGACGWHGRFWKYEE